MAYPGNPFDYGGTISGNYSSFDTGVRELVVHPTVTMLTSKLTKILSVFDAGYETTDTLTPHFLREEIEAIGTSNAILFGADYDYTDPVYQTRASNVCMKSRKSGSISTEALKDRALGPAQNRKQRTINNKMAALMRDMNYNLVWSTESLTSSNSPTTMRGLLSAIHNGGTLETTTGHNTEVGGALTEDNFITNILEKMTTSAAGYECSDVFFQQGHIKVVNGFTGWTSTAIHGAAAVSARVEMQTKSRGEAIEYYDAGYGDMPVRFHWERNDYLTDSGGSKVVIGIHRPMWIMCYFERPTLITVDPPVTGGYKWHSEQYATYSLKDLAGQYGGASMTGLS